MPTTGRDVEVMTVTLEERCVEACVHIQRHSRECVALTDRQGRLTHVITESKSGREAFAGKALVGETLLFRAVLLGLAA